MLKIERAADKCKVNVFSARPGVLIGKRELRLKVSKRAFKSFLKSEGLFEYS